MTVTTDAIRRAWVRRGVLDDQIVMTDAPAPLGVAVDLPVPDDEDGEDETQHGMSLRFGVGLSIL